MHDRPALPPRNADVVMLPGRPDPERTLARGETFFIYRDNEPEPRQPAAVIHACPCGCGGRSMLWLKGRSVQGPEWSVEGEWPQVTLQPSIGISISPMHDAYRRRDGYHWHGYLKAGRYVELPDT